MESLLPSHHMAAKAPPAKAKAKKGFDPNAVGVFSYLGSHHVNTDYGLGPNAIGTYGGHPQPQSKSPRIRFAPDSDIPVPKIDCRSPRPLERHPDDARHPRPSSVARYRD